MFLKLSLMAIAVVFIGAGLGVTAYAWQSGTFQTAGSAIMASPARAAAPSGPVVDRIGSEYRLAASAGYPTTVLWVEEIAVWAFRHAYEDRNDRGMDTVFRVYGHIEVPDGSLVRVVGTSKDAVHLEVLEGRLKGSRGWTDHPIARIVPSQIDPTPSAVASIDASIPCDLCGQRRRLHHHNMDQWASARNRTSVDVLRRATRTDERYPDWPLVSDGQVVTVIQVDGDVAEVELFGGGINGTRVWVPLEDLGN